MARNGRVLSVDFGVERDLELELTTPAFAKTRDWEPVEAESSGTWPDMRESVAESLVIPRESVFGPPPPPPPKDGVRQKQGSPNEDGAGKGGRRRDSQASGRSFSGEISVGITASTLEAFPAPPVPPIPAGKAVPERPERPSRPPSMRLSSMTRNGPLTSNKVVLVGRWGSISSRPGTAKTARTAATLNAASTRRTSWASNPDSKSRRIKYGRGEYATTELVPQPSDDPRDPLNWPTWKKELNFYALLMTVSLVGVMKTAFVSINGILAHDYRVSYVAAAALTGAPLMVSALTGLASVTFSRVWGRRPVYLASMVVIFIGSVWSTRVTRSFAQCMAARIFQGLGWGAFDTLVLGSIQDTYFEHERLAKVATARIVAVASTWGPPLIGGVTSQNRIGFSLQFYIIDAFQAVSILLLVFGAPETMFDRTTSLLQTPITGASIQYPWSRRFVTRRRIWGVVKEYVREAARPYSYSGPSLDLNIALQAPRAMVAPTTVLSVFVSFLPFCALWGFSSSLSLFFSASPFQLFPATIGSLMAAPFILATSTVAAFALDPQWLKTFKVKTTNVYATTGGAVLSFVGILGFGLYVSSKLTAAPNLSGALTPADPNSGDPASAVRGGSSSDIRLPAVSFLLGLLTAGAYVLDATSRPLIRQSTQFTSPNLALALRNTADMDAGVAAWRALLGGAFAVAVPAAVGSSRDGLRQAGIGIAVVQLVVCGLVAAAWFVLDESLRRMDGRVLGCVDLAFLKKQGSFFDLD